MDAISESFERCQMDICRSARDVLDEVGGVAVAIDTAPVVEQRNHRGVAIV